MFKKIMLLSVLLLMTPALALASSARLEGLGVMPDFVEDYANIFAYPVSITRYPAVVVGELGYSGGWGRGFGATMGLGEDNAYGVFGIMLREHSAFGPIPGWSGSGGTQFDVLWGMNFGTASFALRFDNSSDEFEYTDEDGDGMSWSPLYFYYMVGPEDMTVNDLNTMGIGVSVGMEVREADKIEAAFEYRTLDFMVDEIGGDESWQDKGEPSYSFRGRGFFSVAENMSVVPMLGYGKYDYSWEYETPVPDDELSSDQTLSNMAAGLGLRVDVGSFFMLGLGYSQWKAEVDNSFGDPTPDPDEIEMFEFTSTSMPFLFGCFESDVRDWLTLRFGAKKHLVKEEISVEYVGGYEDHFKTKNGNLPDDVRDYLYFNGIYVPVFDEPFMFSMGLGFKFGDLEIDATVNEDYPFTGMYWLSGVDEEPFGKISITYHY